MHVTRKLVNAIISLAASLIACVFVCYAWFAENKQVSANSLSTSVKGSDIKSFEVTVYKVTYSDNVYYQGNEMSESLVMERLDSTFGNIETPTAVLLKFDYEIYESDKTFIIAAENSASEITIELTTEATDDTAEEYTTPLANAIEFESVTLGTADTMGTSLTIGDSASSFTSPASSASAAAISDFVSLDCNSLTLFDGITTDGSGLEEVTADGETYYTGTSYIILDYNSDVINAFYEYLMQVEQAGLTSTIAFSSDALSFVLQEYTATASEE